MSETLIGTIISCIVTLIGIFVSNSSTRNAIANDLKTNQAVMNNEFDNIKREVNELKDDVKKHNNYGLQIKGIETRLGIMEERIKEWH